MEGVNVCACTSHMTLGINARVPQHGITRKKRKQKLIRSPHSRMVCVLVMQAEDRGFETR
ncbi:hypothetical protein BpHYR1_035025 [Brachionus plicatilis]|uniref:Uncharacterized protein n=1 Tax=Brachionus plicatilis TaxID=10195 RepID=A0A3M7QS65_BRAPC|nr:hypothetical protein BpHYR1_035025 [Brachionus plicatilis]